MSLYKAIIPLLTLLVCNTPAFSAAAAGVARITNNLAHGSLIRLPIMSGSLPLYAIDQALHVANHDDNQDVSNENLRLQNLWDAIDIYASLLTRL